MTQRQLFIKKFYDDTEMYISPNGVCIQQNDLHIFTSYEKTLFPAIVSKRITKAFGTPVPDDFNRFPERNAFVCYKGDTANDDHIVKVRGEAERDYLMHDYLITTSTTCWDVRYFINRKSGVLSSVSLSNHRSSLHFNTPDSECMIISLAAAEGANPEDDEIYFLNPLQSERQEQFEVAQLDFLERVTSLSLIDLVDDKTKIAAIQDAAADVLERVFHDKEESFFINSSSSKEVRYDSNGDFVGTYDTIKLSMGVSNCNFEREFEFNSRYNADRVAKILTATLIQLIGYKTMRTLQNPFKSEQLNRTFRKVKNAAGNPTDNGRVMDADDYIVIYNGEVHKYKSTADASNDMYLWRLLFGYRTIA